MKKKGWKTRLIVNDVYELTRDDSPRMRGLIVSEAARELDVSERTIFRMLYDGRLKGEKVYLPYAKDSYLWIISPMEIARFQVRKQMTAELKALAAELKAQKRLRRRKKKDKSSIDSRPEKID